MKESTGGVVYNPINSPNLWAKIGVFSDQTSWIMMLGAQHEATFEINANILIELELEDKIKKIISQYEPRIRNPIINVTDESDKNAYRVSISFEVSYDTNTEIIIYLTRTR